MSDAILVINAGSSSIKFSLFALEQDLLSVALSGLIEELGGNARFVARDAQNHVVDEHRWADDAPPGHAGAMQFLREWLGLHLGSLRLIGVGHRIVHGGTRFARPMRVTGSTVAALEALTPLAPLHQPYNVLPIKAVLQAMPDLPQVACFDTAFHRSQSKIAQMYALPRKLTDAGIRRYGFHGLSFEHIASVLPSYDGKAAAGKTVVLHLGNGASMCAMNAGRSVAATTGFSAVEGLPMGTRCGSLDPGVLLYLQDEMKLTARDVERLLYKESGLLGVSGVSSDMRVLQSSGNPDAHEAIELFCYRIGRELGSLAAALGGLDAIVFTGGIGEHSAPVREQVCQHARWLGLLIDSAANKSGAPCISRADSTVAAWVIPANEELVIARHTKELLQS
ncbi:putative propionate kinase [Andreprevotia sp. IGB-42]|uniref:acetate/propionate family kinase n=1 Tax=Andreprevotia sp. IGB-42 TaxID=2497473 RepID=UPI001359ACC8|nr:acetate/propionate family kinase [Andreprevotia sp. IGB-42]KAF0814501.1 putative propionate kinase [Andreprevotia sp. IGB-42]